MCFIRSYQKMQGGQIKTTYSICILKAIIRAREIGGKQHILEWFSNDCQKNHYLSYYFDQSPQKANSLMNQFLAIACNLLKEWGKDVLGLGFGVQGVIGFCFVSHWLKN